MLTAALSCTPAPAAPAVSAELSSDNPVVDLARLVPDGQEAALAQQLRDLQQQTGWRVRLLTRAGPGAGPTLEQVRRAWAPDARTVVVVADPTSPNILSFNYGDQVMEFLRRPFFVELQSRYGNMFYAREQGESRAVLDAVGALVGCLQAPGGCAVVPGLPEDQYYLTLYTSVAGGFVFGFASLLEPQSFVRRKWVWLLLFAPLWGTLFISFGIGPIVTRTADRIPVLANTAAFLTAAAVFRLSPLFSRKAIDGRSFLTKQSQQEDQDR